LCSVGEGGFWKKLPARTNALGVCRKISFGWDRQATGFTGKILGDWIALAIVREAVASYARAGGVSNVLTPLGIG